MFVVLYVVYIFSLVPQTPQTMWRESIDWPRWGRWQTATRPWTSTNAPRRVGGTWRRCGSKKRERGREQITHIYIMMCYSSDWAQQHARRPTRAPQHELKQLTPQGDTLRQVHN